MVTLYANINLKEEAHYACSKMQNGSECVYKEGKSHLESGN